MKNPRLKFGKIYGSVRKPLRTRLRHDNNMKRTKAASTPLLVRDPYCVNDLLAIVYVVVGTFHKGRALRSLGFKRAMYAGAPETNDSNRSGDDNLRRFAS
jgi:hypothetical protein